MENWGLDPQSPTSLKTAIRAGISFVKRALWKRDIGSPLASAIFCIFVSFSTLPVAKYKNESRSKFFVCWYAFSTICTLKIRGVLDDRKGGSYFVVSLFESGLSKTFPTVGSVDDLGGLESNVKVAALDGEVEPGALILDEMECDLLLGEANRSLREIRSHEPLDTPFVVNMR